MPESETRSVTVHSSLDINFKTCLSDNWLLQAMALLCVCARASACMCACVCVCVFACVRACASVCLRACVRAWCAYPCFKHSESAETFSLAGT